MILKDPSGLRENERKREKKKESFIIFFLVFGLKKIVWEKKKVSITWGPFESLFSFFSHKIFKKKREWAAPYEPMNFLFFPHNQTHTKNLSNKSILSSKIYFLFIFLSLSYNPNRPKESINQRCLYMGHE